MGEAKRRGTFEQRRTAALNRSPFALVAAVGIVADRSATIEQIRAQAKLHSLQENVQFEDALQRWLQADDQPAYWIFASRNDGRCIDWHPGDLAVLRHTVTLINEDYRARQQNCLLVPCPPVNPGEAGSIGAMLQELNPQIPAPDVLDDSWPPKGLTLRAYEVPGKGRLTFVGVDHPLGDPSPLLRLLDSMIASKKSIDAHAGRVHITFDGYDDDPREIFEIEGPRDYLQRVAKHAPWWSLLSAPESLHIWLAACARIEGVSKGEQGAIRMKFHDPQEVVEAAEASVAATGVALREAAYPPGEDLDDLVERQSVTLGMALQGMNLGAMDPMWSAAGRDQAGDAERPGS